MSDINVLYYSCPFDLSGYGTVSRNHLLKLAKISNIRLRLRTKKFWTGVVPDLKDNGGLLHAMERVAISESKFIFIEHLTPENFYIDPRASYHIAYTPFETDSMPPAWLLPLRGMDEVWVPSKHNKTAYINAGLRDKRIEVIPHGIDVDRFNPSIPPLKYERGEFNFGSVFDWSERKNPVALIRAYYNAFSGGEPVTLTIRTFWRFPVEATKDYVTQEVQKIKNGYVGRKFFPKILFWYDTMNEDIVPNFYRSFDCFVLPTRGEGFGLPFLEAMACGVPTIGPNWGGSKEFMNDANSILVRGNVVPINNFDFLRRQPQYGGQNWFEIDEVELSKSMRYVYDKRSEVKAMTDKAVEDIKNNFTWDNTAGKIYKRLLEINRDIQGE